MSPYQAKVGNGAGRITTACRVTITHKSGEHMYLTIHPESGYVDVDFIVYKS